MKCSDFCTYTVGAQFCSKCKEPRWAPTVFLPKCKREGCNRPAKKTSKGTRLYCDSVCSLKVSKKVWREKRKKAKALLKLKKDWECRRVGCNNDRREDPRREGELLLYCTDACRQRAADQARRIRLKIRTGSTYRGKRS